MKDIPLQILLNRPLDEVDPGRTLRATHTRTLTLRTITLPISLSLLCSPQYRTPEHSSSSTKPCTNFQLL